MSANDLEVVAKSAARFNLTAEASAIRVLARTLRTDTLGLEQGE